MIEKTFNKYRIICDNCGEDGQYDYESFHEAVDNKKEEGFISKKYDNGWKDLCPNCK